jgi:preprotein translocase subunit SecB
MMELQLSPISAVSYQILRSNYEVVDLECSGLGANNLGFQYKASDLAQQEDGASKLEVHLEVSVVPGGDNPSGFKLDVAVRGIFMAQYSEDGGTIEDFELFMKVNSFTLLYAFIRSHVQMLTSMTPSGQICLPCLDVGSIARNLTAPADESGDVDPRP